MKERDKRVLGREAELQVADFYERMSFVVKERNYRYRRAEVDLIVQKNDLLVFVEVKYRSHTGYGYPEEFVSDSQQQLILSAADYYLQSENWQKDIRFDIAAVDGSGQITLFEDAFY